MSKILVDGGVTINIMLMITFRRLGKGPKDLIKMNVILKDFEGGTSKAERVLNVMLTLRIKTIPAYFFFINGKVSYNLLLGRDWIHVNYCIPFTMHQLIIQWKRDQVEIVPVDTIVNVATTDLYIYSSWTH
jgi:hypothetical protein